MSWQDRIDAAAARINGHVVRTPTLAYDGFGLGYPIELKFEQFQHTGSFKARGAFNSLLSMDVPEAGIVAASGGNHGAAVGFAAAKLGIKAKIFVPEIAGPAKIALVKSTGAEVVILPGTPGEALKAAQAWEADTGALQIHPYDAPATVEGQGTMGREWEEQGLEADTILIAVGGGGLIGGAMAWFGNRRKIVAVEPELAPTLNRALAEGPETEVEVSGVAMNSLGGPKAGRICYELAKEIGLQSITVPDAAITSAQNLLWRELRQLVEPGGACALSALTSGAYVPAENERIAVLVCGGNIAPDPLA